MRAPGARLRPVPLPAHDLPEPHAFSAHTQRDSMDGACSLPSRSPVLARSGLMVDASSSGAPQDFTNFQRDGIGRPRTWDRRAGAHFSSDISPRCAALSPVLGCPRRACRGKCPRPAATCHACLTSDTPASRPTPSQACLQLYQPSWQPSRSARLRCRVRSWLRAPLFNSLTLHRVPPRAHFRLLFRRF